MKHSMERFSALMRFITVATMVVGLFLASGVAVSAEALSERSRFCVDTYRIAPTISIQAALARHQVAPFGSP